MFENFIGRVRSDGSGNRPMTAKEVLRGRIDSMVNRNAQSAGATPEPAADQPVIEVSETEVEEVKAQDPAVESVPDPEQCETNSPAADDGEPIERASDEIAGEPQSDNDDDDILAITQMVFLSADVVGDDSHGEAVRQNAGIVGYLMDDLHLRPRELSRNAYCAFAMDFYVNQIINGGHGQLVAAADEHPHMWGAVREGLVNAGAEDHIELYDAFTAALAADPEWAEKLRIDGKKGRENTIAGEFDARFIELNSETPLIAIIGGWLLSCPDLVVLEKSELDVAIAALAEHPAILERHVAQLAKVHGENRDNTAESAEQMELAACA